MFPTPPYPEVILKKGREQSVKSGHPWIFSGALQKGKLLSNGTVVHVLAASGKPIATGQFFNSSIAVRLFAFQPTIINSDFIRRRVVDAVEFRRGLGLIGNEHTNAFRLINAESDSLPGLIVDVYGNCAVMELNNECMFELRTDLAGILMAALDSAMPGVVRAVYGRAAYLGWEDYIGTKLQNETSGVIMENNLRFEVDWKEGQKTGFFLDQRDSRNLIRSVAKNRSVLNCFSYTGGFSVSALAGGARAVVSVDSSRSAIKAVEKNLFLNSLADSNHTSKCEDCFDYLKQRERTFDIVILDPPAFAKHKSAVKNALRGYGDLNRLGAQAVAEYGLMFTYSCSQLVEPETFEKIVTSEFNALNRRFHIEHRLSQASCHRTIPAWPEGKYLKGLVVRFE
jgi:23S rRNA (cytosine1962-C5)-methyltransferase